MNELLTAGSTGKAWATSCGSIVVVVELDDVESMSTTTSMTVPA